MVIDGNNAELMKVTEPMEPGSIDAVDFDVGDVLIDSDSRRLSRNIFHDADGMETFLRRVCTSLRRRVDVGYRRVWQSGRLTTPSGVTPLRACRRRG
jgi:hypothetical protein